MNRLVSWMAVVIGGLIAVALLVQAWNGMPQPPLKPQGPVGSIQAITLVNGQIYFGTLRSQQTGSVVLGDVFDLQVNVNQQTNQRTTQIIRRRTGNVHGPIDMVIPTEKILFIESVGKGSPVATAIANMDAAAQKGAPPSTGTPEAGSAPTAPAPSATAPAAPSSATPAPAPK